MADIFPPRYLPGLADKWGRVAESRIVALEKGQKAAGSSLNNSDRSTSGQLAVIAQQLDIISEQVTELNSRATYSDFPANLQLIIGSGSGEVGPSSRAVSFPAPPGGARNAIIYGSGGIAWTGTATGPTGIAETVTVGLEFRQSGGRVWYTNSTASSAAFFSFQAANTFSLAIPVQVPEGGSTFDIRMWVGKTSSGGQTNAGARLENMSFSIVYGEKY